MRVILILAIIYGSLGKAQQNRPYFCLGRSEPPSMSDFCAYDCLLLNGSINRQVLGPDRLADIPMCIYDCLPLNIHFSPGIHIIQADFTNGYFERESERIDLLVAEISILFSMIKKINDRPILERVINIAGAISLLVLFAGIVAVVCAAMSKKIFAKKPDIGKYPIKVISNRGYSSIEQRMQ